MLDNNMIFNIFVIFKIIFLEDLLQRKYVLYRVFENK